jgi:hypothetical protein
VHLLFFIQAPRAINTLHYSNLEVIFKSLSIIKQQKVGYEFFSNHLVLIVSE